MAKLACPDCGKKFKGLKGVATHQRIHKVAAISGAAVVPVHQRKKRVVKAVVLNGEQFPQNKSPEKLTAKLSLIAGSLSVATARIGEAYSLLNEISDML